MMLALVILCCIALSFLAAGAVRRGVLHAWTAVPLVTLVPLAGWLAFQARAGTERSPWEFQVLGQYHRLADTLAVGTSADADVVLRGSALPDTRLVISYAGGNDSIRVQVLRSARPVLVGDVPVNAARIGRRATIRSSSGDSVAIVRPWYCMRCDTRVVQAGSARREVRVSNAAPVAVGADTVRIFRIGARTWVSADPQDSVTVDGALVTGDVVAASDSLRIGVPAIARLDVRASAVDHRFDVYFERSRSARRWTLPPADADTLRLLVAATNGDPVPGTMPVINPAGVAPGAVRAPYGGLLRQQGTDWQWLADGTTREFATDAEERLPGGGARGHIVRLRQFDTNPTAARVAVIIAWIAGALALARALRLLHPEALALRVFLLGCVYTLVCVRGTLAFRAWLAPPHDTTSPITFIALLLALPLLAALLHVWANNAGQDRMLRSRALRIDAAAVTAPVLLAAIAAGIAILPDWRMDVLRAAVGAVAGGVLGLVILNRLLLASSPHNERRHPIAAVAVAPHEGFTYREFLYAVVLLGVFGLLLLIVTELVKYGTLLALLGWGAILVAVLLSTSGPRALIQPRGRQRTLLIAAPAAIASALLAIVLGVGVIAAVAAFVIGGGIAWVLTTRATLRLRPVHLRDLVGPSLTVALLGSLGAVLFPGLLAKIRVLAEYGLALAGLMVVARIFAILWFRHTHQIATRIRTARATSVLPGAAAIAVVLMMLAAAVYIPLAVFDTGLVLLFFAATVTVVFTGFWMIGARALGGAIAAGVVVAFFLGMFVRQADLLDGSADLNTARIRFAATYHPDALQRHMLMTDDGRPITVVRTLQQYWGMRHFAAAGTTGRGYFDADQADWIVPRPVALTENVFSAFVLSEHGWLGGSAVLLCYLSIALALLYGAWRACARTTAAPRALLLVGVSAFFVVPAFYIAAANGLLLPLTGQNMPMLGLLSSADVALASWLAALGLIALPVEAESGGAHVRSGGWHRRLRNAVVIIALLFGGSLVTLAGMLWKPAHAEVGDFGMDALAGDIEGLVEQGAVTVAAGTPDTIAIAPVGARHPYLREGSFLRSRIARANAIARNESSGAGCLDADPLLRARDDGTVDVHSSLCSLRAVVEGRRDWKGALVVDAGAAEFAITDGSSAIVLDPRSTDVGAIGRGCAATVARAHSVRIGCGADAAVISFGTTAPVLERGSASLLVNGEAAGAPVIMHDRDHLHVAGAADAWVVEVPRGALAYPRWENGVTRRVHDLQLEPWLAQVDTQLARGLSNEDRSSWNATATIRPQLQRRLQRALADACAAAPGVRRCSALIADPLTGEVQAFTATFNQPHRYLPTDANLRNHPAASAIKPIIAAAALHAYPSLRTLQVEHAASEYDVIANTPVSPPVRAARLHPSPMVPWQGFLGASDNVYAITLGFLAASDRAGDAPALRGSAAQSRMQLNGRALRGQPSWVGRGTADLGGSPLAASLDTLFGTHAASAGAPPYERAFWQAAVDAGAIVQSGDVQRITPEPVALSMDAVASPRQFSSFLLGGGRNRWNNVALVQAFSRIYTGRAVQLHVVRTVGTTALAAEAPVMDGFDVARNAVLDGLDAVVMQPWGTGSSLRGIFAPKVTWRAKTGTLQEREWNGSIFLFAGSAAERGDAVCAAAGILSVEMSGNASPDGRATAMFREAIAPLLQEELGWGARACTATRAP